MNNNELYSLSNPAFLSGGIVSGATTLGIRYSVLWPTNLSGSFRVLIDKEILRLQGAASGSLTYNIIAQGAEQTIISAHNDYALVGQLFTPQSIKNLVGGVNLQTGTAYTVNTVDVRELVVLDNLSGIAVTLPQASNGDTDDFGPKFETTLFNLLGSGVVTPASGQINSGSSLPLNSGQWARVWSDGANYWATLAGAGTGGGTTLTSGIITSGYIGNAAVLSGSIGSGQIASGMLASGFIAGLGSVALTSGQVTSGFLGNASVVSGSIASEQIAWQHLTSGLTTSGLYLSGSIGSGQIGLYHLASGLVSGLILSGQIGSGQIAAVHIQSGTLLAGPGIGVTFGLSGILLTNLSGAGGVASLVSGSVQSGNIASGAVNFVNLASGITSGLVLSGQIGSGQIDWVHVISGFTISGLIKSGAIGSGQIGVYHLQSGLVTSGLYLSGSIGSGQLDWVHHISGYTTSGLTKSGAIGSGQIDWVHVISGFTTSGLTKSGAIGSGQIGVMHLQSGLVTSGLYLSGSIGSGQIAAVHIQSGTLIAGPGIGVVFGLSGVTLNNLSGNGSIGTVTSVGLSMPSQFAVSGSPVTTSGVLSVTLPAAIILADGSQAFAADQSLGSHKLTNVTDPASPQDAATKSYVDAAVQGITSKHAATCATTTTLPSYTYLAGVITFSSTGGETVDGHSVALNDYVLVKNETSTNKPYNGLYKVTTVGAVGVAGVWTRSVDMDAGSEFPGATVFIEQGSTNAGTSWICTNSTPPSVGTDDITFVQFGAGGGGSGITQLTGEVTAGPGSGSQAATVTRSTDFSGTPWTHQHTWQVAGLPVDFVNTTNSASVEVARFEGKRGTGAANDAAYLSFYLANATPAQKEIARQTVTLASATAGAESSTWSLSLSNFGTLTTIVTLDYGSNLTFTNGVTVACGSVSASTSGHDINVTSGTGGTTVSGTAGVGGDLFLAGGPGGASSGSGTPGQGGQGSLIAGAGGTTGGSHAAGTGGTATLGGGAGGSGGASGLPGAGGDAYVKGGDAGTLVAGSGAVNGGNVYIRGGNLSSTGAYGAINIGDTTTSSVAVGWSACDSISFTVKSSGTIGGAADGQIIENIGGVATGIPLPLNVGGRLSPQSSTLIPTSDQTAVTTIYWVPGTVIPGDIGDQLIIYDGTRWKPFKQSTQLSLNLTATSTGNTHGSTTLDGLTASVVAQLVPGMQVTGTDLTTQTVTAILSSTSIQLSAPATGTHSGNTYTFKLPESTGYDVIVVNDGGTLRPLFSPAWTSATARASAVTTQDGITVNSGSWTTGWTNGGATVATLTGTVIGSISTTTTAGQTESSVTNRYVISLINPVPLLILLTPGYVDDNAQTTYTTTSTTNVVANGGTGATGNYISLGNGLPMPVKLAMVGKSSVPAFYFASIGDNSTTTGTTEVLNNSTIPAGGACAIDLQPAFGIRSISILIRTNSGTATFFADDSRGGGSHDPHLTFLSALMWG